MRLFKCRSRTLMKAYRFYYGYEKITPQNFLKADVQRHLIFLPRTCFSFLVHPVFGIPPVRPKAYLGLRHGLHVVQSSKFQ